jgi:hypothetical protein
MKDRNEGTAEVVRPGRFAEALEFGRRHPLRVLLVLLVVLSAIVAARVWYKSRPPRLSIACFVVEEAAPYNANDYQEDPEAQFLLMDQIIVTGPPPEVSEVISGFSLTLTSQCDLSYQNAHNLDLESFPFPSEALSDLTMRLYQIEPGQSVVNVAKTINEAGSGHHVFADPNYLTGPFAGASACGNPTYEDGGSPLAGISPLPATAGQFWGQWAFEHVGAGPSLQDALQGALINPTGAGVRVGVFDTSPFTPVSAMAIEDSEGGIHFSETIAQVTPNLKLSVSHPKMRDLQATDPAAATNVNDHGLFVAGLIHAIAPESDIQLIRVLNEYGCGDLFTLTKALYQFIADMEAERGMLDGTVINLSLGVLKPASGEVLADDTIESLRAAVLLAHSRGAVVVAAAGNDSYIEGKPLPPQIPARYPFVIGVAGSNVYREKACFSNWGDVSAPSGDSPSEEGPGYCKREVLTECSGDCDEAVISLALSPSTAGDTTRYAYWRGTSFSAPLVSGLAALVLDAGVSRPTCPLKSPAWVHPDRVIEAIRCGTSTGDGVINVPATLFRCMP